MASLFVDAQAALIILAGPALMWISAVTVGALFALAGLLIALRFLRRFS